MRLLIHAINHKIWGQKLGNCNKIFEIINFFTTIFLPQCYFLQKYRRLYRPCGGKHFLLAQWLFLYVLINDHLDKVYGKTMSHVFSSCS